MGPNGTQNFMKYIIYIYTLCYVNCNHFQFLHSQLNMVILMQFPKKDFPIYYCTRKTRLRYLMIERKFKK